MKLRFSYLFLALLFNACYFQEETPADQKIWEYGSPEMEGMDRAGLLLLDVELKALSYGRINSLIVIKNDKLIFENYYNGTNRSSLMPVSRTGFSMISACLGIALEEGIISSVDDPIHSYLPQYSSLFEESPDKKLITFRHVMAMKTGLSWNERLLRPDNPDNDLLRIQSASDWAEYILSKDIYSTPGIRYSFNSLAPILLTKAIESASGESFEDFSKSRLFDWLGVENYWINPTSDGHPNSMTGMSMRAIDVVKFGYLFMNGGNIGGDQIIPSDWVNESVTTETTIDFQNDYALLWWRYSQFNEIIDIYFDENDIYYLLGFDGQVIYMVPHLDMIVSINVSADEQTSPYVGYWLLLNHIHPLIQ